MAAKDEQLEYFYGVEQMDRAFSDTIGRIAAMRLGFTPKKPDRAKVKAMLEKAKKPTGPAQARFFLSLDGLKLSFELRIGPAKLVLNILDLGNVRDMDKRRHLLWQLSQRTHLVTETDLAEFDKTQADPEDQKEAVELNKQIDDLKNGIDNMCIMRDGPNYKKKEYSGWDSEFRDWAEAKNFGRFTGFLEDVDAGRTSTNRISALLADPKSSGIRPATRAEIDAAITKGEKPDFTKARKEVAQVVNAHMLPRYNKEKLAELDRKIKESIQKAEELKKKVKALKAD